MALIHFAEDDERWLPTIRSVGSFFARSGHEVVVSTNGREVAASFDANCPDVLVADATLWGADGFELAKLLRSSRKAGHSYVLLLCTPAAEPGWLLTGLRDDALGLVDEFIVRPLTPGNDRGVLHEQLILSIGLRVMRPGV